MRRKSEKTKTQILAKYKDELRAAISSLVPREKITAQLERDYVRLVKQCPEFQEVLLSCKSLKPFLDDPKKIKTAESKWTKQFVSTFFFGKPHQKRKE